MGNTYGVARDRSGGGVGVGGIARNVFGSEGIDLEQRGRRLAHVELAGDDIGDQAGAVFAEEADLAVGAGGSQGWPASTVQIRRSRPRSLVSVVMPLSHQIPVK